MLKKISTFSRAFFLVFSLLFLGACAGPSTPFGALSLFDDTNEVSESGDTAAGGVEIEVYPKSKVFHKSSQVRVHIKDPKGVGPQAQVQVLYNNRDVTDSFKRRQSRDKNPREIQLVFDGLRLPAHKVHDIQVLYRNNHNSGRLHKVAMGTPKCDFRSTQPISTLLKFKVKDETIRDLEEVAFNNEMNPSLLAALAAQESGFNPKAVSWYRAIGLTQVTHIAEKEIMEHVKDWPRYPKIQRYSYPQLKYKILRDKINENNEWRLDPRLSLEGGAHYFDVLEKYWSREDKKKLVAQSGGDLTRVMLASYNIGPATVSRAIKRGGKNWLKDREGKTSTKYVNLVTSYCQNFAEGDQT